MRLPAICEQAGIVALESEPLLTLERLTKRFAGVTATDDLSLGIAPGEVHAVIGPNGAGKTTLIGQITGEIKSDTGRVVFDGQDITAMPAAGRTRLGIARSYQIARIFPDLTVLENVMLALVSKTRRSFQFWRPVARIGSLHEPAASALDLVGLLDRAPIIAGTLAHGEKRALELAMILATEPGLLLIDEPMAGLGPGEAAELLRLLLRLKGRFAMLLIEHDIAAVFALSDRITVLVSGHAIVTDTPARVRCDPSVQEAYLGDQLVRERAVVLEGEVS